jgi:hypothetical protein
VDEKSNYENNRADCGKNQRNKLESTRRWPLRTRQNLFARCDVDFVRAHGFAPIGVVDAAPDLGFGLAAGVCPAGVCVAAVSTGAA